MAIRIGSMPKSDENCLMDSSLGLRLQLDSFVRRKRTYLSMPITSRNAFVFAVMSFVTRPIMMPRSMRACIRCCSGVKSMLSSLSSTLRFWLLRNLVSIWYILNGLMWLRMQKPRILKKMLTILSWLKRNPSG